MKLTHRILNLCNTKYTKSETYGNKRDYKKIDIYLGGKYVGSTTWSRNLEEALYHYVACDEPVFDSVLDEIEAVYSK